ncbi:hypothetical protein HYE67_002119 [Fusarium culmorum]|uniref:Uncharacterized protein n=1 Tax=Fusarium culmorum TaxID=5516 RepID=A0A7S8HSP8_FUSCU|nr:hypothetical protein HYE67_002119 [Fusarium culmorum]
MPDNRTILGPLTETWTFPSRCNQFYLPDCSSCTVASQGQKCNTANPTTIDSREDIQCWPPGTPPNVFDPPLSGWGIYKPADKCPEGYTVACSAEGTTKSDFEFQFEVHDDEFVRGCCPSHYECAKYEGAQTCRSIFSRGRIQMFSCKSGSTVLNDLKAPTQWLGPGYTTIGSITIHAPMFQLAGLENFETTTDTALASSTETSQPNMESDSGGGLSTGEQAGIGIGVGVVGLGILVAAFYLWRRRERSKVPPKYILEPSQLDSREVNPPGELGGIPIAPPPYTPVELHGTTARQELP